MKRMTPSPNPSDAAAIKAFAGIPGPLERTPAHRGPDAVPAVFRFRAGGGLGGPGIFRGDLFRRDVAPVLGQILKQSTPTKQGEHV
ncbi:hypothetical protein KMZ68_22405 [Bradyrhizobium sediminis]|uniref:Uncharacterized protein n=1 Tax=Bradyrhizobium sediminis TaxID=2840469 RepID=A0A975NMQ9_9BRAD|nr:hypothetical protein [Bradyrhizobium sediminis]QWG17680.1 hypothetical protein KMZ68_22405 [Bradyrhizobium sediminis]